MSLIDQIEKALAKKPLQERQTPSKKFIEQYRDEIIMARKDGYSQAQIVSGLLEDENCPCKRSTLLIKVSALLKENLLKEKVAEPETATASATA